MLKMQGLVQSIAFVMFFYMVPLTQFQIFVPSGTFSQSRSHNNKEEELTFCYISVVSDATFTIIFGTCVCCP